MGVGAGGEELGVFGVEGGAVDEGHGFWFGLRWWLGVGVDWGGLSMARKGVIGLLNFGCGGRKG